MTMLSCEFFEQNMAELHPNCDLRGLARQRKLFADASIPGSPDLEPSSAYGRRYLDAATRRACSFRSEQRRDAAAERVVPRRWPSSHRGR